MNQTATMWSKILDFLFPRSSLVQEIQEMSPQKFASRAARAEPLGEPLSYWARAIFSYKNNLVKAAVWELKYRKNRRVAEMLGEVLYDELLSEASDLAIFENVDDVLIIPIPLSGRRAMERGFNQAEMLARAICRVEAKTPFEVAAEALIRIRDTRSQTSIKDRDERIENVIGCFSVKDTGTVHDSNIILLDDVITTGATMNEARKALLEAGARKVVGVAVAH